MKLLWCVVSMWMASLLPGWAAGKGKGEWVADYEVAIEQAAKDKRCVFLLFTNSKHCVPCLMFKQSVVSQREFLRYASKKLVLLEVDYAPSFDDGAKVQLTEIEQDKKVPREFCLRGRGPWPYLFVLSPTGEVLFSGEARGDDRNTVRDFIKFLDGLQKR